MAKDIAFPILLVDDHRSMLLLISRQLQQLGFSDVDTAGDPVTALTMLRQRRYGLILSDWNMEPMDGLAFLQAVRRDPAHAATPFLLVTAETRSAQVLAAKRAGVDGYLVKPVDAEQLRARLAAVTGRS